MSNFTDLWYESSDGLRLYARDYPCRKSSNTNPTTILCMHGLTRNSADFASLADHLSGSNRVISVDQRGRGRSDYDTSTANYTPLTYAQDMFTLLDKLELQRVVLIGTSMGGLMSLLMGAMQSKRILGAVINDIGPEIDPRGLERIKAYVGKTPPVSRWDEAIAQCREINGEAYPEFSDQEWLDFTRVLYRDQAGIPVLAYDPAISQPMEDEESGAVPPDLWPVFEACLGIPMLVVRGELSDILSLDCVQAMRLRKSDLRFVEIPRRGHAPTLNEPSARAAIDEFIGAL